jgi:hypothetical protein
MTSSRQKLITAVEMLLFVVGSFWPVSSHADVPVQLTPVGNPIWRPTDFHLFTAPCEPSSAFDEVADLIVPFNAPPKNPPYEDILSERIAAAGFQDSSIFVPSEIDGQPLGIYYAFLLIPDPGETGSSRDVASGPIIPNRLFPISDNTDILRNGVVVDGDLDGQFPPAFGFGGKSYDSALFCDDAVFFPPGIELTGTYEWRSVLRDSQGNGWNIIAPFQVVPESGRLTGDFNDNGLVDAADYVAWQNGGPLLNDPTPGSVGSEDYSVWRENFGRSTADNSEAGSAVPESATWVLMLAGGLLLALRFGGI